jgi:hypothetical protein
MVLYSHYYWHDQRGQWAIIMGMARGVYIAIVLAMARGVYITIGMDIIRVV